ncbi:MAG TPA: D-amino-acid oxidase, partial [Phenylobacterium sp.]|nr:D-amino-acid oxidase [Phenylobacterium sp.]
PGATPFQVAGVTRAALPMFNITEYGHVLMTDFLIGGGRIETQEFHSPAELATLPQKVIINCTGYGARALWKDESIVPVRGQLAWLIPQPELGYGVYYRGVSTVARRDGLIVQKTGADDSFGLNDDNEAPDRAEAEESVKVIASLFGRRGA